MSTMQLSLAALLIVLGLVGIVVAFVAACDAEGRGGRLALLVGIPGALSFIAGCIWLLEQVAAYLVRGA